MQGIILSGGQKQRISVARAMYQQTNVVFLVRLHTEITEQFKWMASQAAPVIYQYSLRNCFCSTT